MRLALAVMLALAPALHAQTPLTYAKRDSMVADSLVKLRPWLNGWRLQTLNNQIKTLRSPLEVPPPNAAPVASFTFPVGGCKTGDICTFSSTSTDDKGVVSQSWNCPSGSPACSASTGVTASTVYAVAGTYPVTLTVQDAEGLSASTTQSVPVVAAQRDSVVNTAPVAAFVVSDSTGKCKVGRPCTFDGGPSRDDKGITGYAWDCGTIPNCASGGKTTTATFANAPDMRTVSLTVSDSEGLTNRITRQIEIVDTTKTQPDTTFKYPTLPQSTPDASPKPCTVHKDIVIPMDLQLALNAAQPGECLDLAPGQEWQGNFNLPARTCAAGSAWTTIQTKGVVDAPGVRMTGVNAAGFAKITSANSQYALRTRHPTCNWVIQHLNIGRDPNNSSVLVYHLLVLGDGAWASGGDENVSLATQPRDIIVRRNWIHGTASGELVRCVVMNGIRLAVVDNWIDDCHASGFDSQAVEGWNGQGPLLVQNNFLAGAGENVMFGGADPASDEQSPQDITIRGNHVYKDPAWKGKWSIKNLLELKNARRILVENNVFENSWVSSQVGMAIVIKSSTGNESSANLNQGTNDLTFLNNSVDAANRGLNIQGADCSAQACTTNPVNRVLAQNNRFTNIGTSNGVVSSGWLNPMSDGPRNIMLRNNTFIGNTPNTGKVTYVNGRQGQWGQIRWYNNVFGSQSDYVIGADCAQPTHAAALDCLIGTGNWQFTGNVVSGVLSVYWSKNPPGNTYKQTLAELGLQPDGSAPQFPGAGANISTLTQKIAGVVIPPATSRGRRAVARPVRYVPTAADSAWCRRHACTLTPR